MRPALPYLASECPHCGARIEKLRRLPQPADAGARPTLACPSCGGLVRLSLHSLAKVNLAGLFAGVLTMAALFAVVPVRWGPVGAALPLVGGVVVAQVVRRLVAKGTPAFEKANA